MFRDRNARYCTLRHLLRLPPGHAVCLLGVSVQVVQSRHPDIADGTHVGLLACVHPLVDPELPLVVELLITESALVQELASVFVLTILPFAPVFVSRPTNRANVPWRVSKMEVFITR